MEEFGESQYLDVLKNSTTSAKHQPAAKAAVRRHSLALAAIKKINETKDFNSDFPFRFC